MCSLKAKFNSIKNSFDPYANKYLFKVVVAMPFTLPRYCLDFLATKYGVLYTNLNISKVPMAVNGCKLLDIFFYVPAVSNFCTGISFISAYDRSGFAVFSDEHSIKYP